MVMKANRGQLRILEAVIAAVIIFIVFSAATFLIRASDVKLIQERGDLDRLGYNVLSRIIESGTIEETIEKPPTPSAIQLKTFVQRSLPSATYFNLTIFKYMFDNDTQWINQTMVVNVSNTAASSFINSMEVSSTPIVYTSKNANIYYMVLVLARAGEGR